ncbi:flagellar export protein FliJ [Cohnella fermenti]|uniref:Flagellar FliJ protein n=1 Tax=Cohnella fermenti TaxID=2565925 RepID=A0A4S4C121_9BACL|nr:flagellar export protein FliJ [Cohnella fermenti]THF81265.1 flagellar export protein FliJ [Cohnella fermenti]
MRFHYPLQKIVDLKGSEKAMAEWEYAAALGKVKTEEETLASLTGDLEQMARALAEQTKRPTSLFEIQRMQEYIGWLEGRIRQQREGVRKAKEAARLRQAKLADRMVDEKVWLNARDRAKTAFDLQTLAEEQNSLDEMAVMRAAASARR